MSVLNLRNAYMNVQTCWQFFADSSAAIDFNGITFGGQDGLSAQRFDSTVDRFGLKEYMEVLLEGSCGETWFTDNIDIRPPIIGGAPKPDQDGCYPGWLM